MTLEGWRIIADVVGHLVWPAGVIVIVLIFRKPLAAFILKVEEAEWGKAKVKVGNQRSSEIVFGTASTTRTRNPLSSAPRSWEAPTPT